MNPSEASSLYEKFEFLSMEDIHSVWEHVKIVELNKGDFFVKSGEINKNLALIKEGLLRYYYIKNNGDEINVFFRWEGNSVGAYQCFFNNSPSSLYIEALEPCVLLCMDYAVIEKLFEKNRKLEKAGKIILQNTLVETLERIESLIINNPEARYLNILKTNPKLYQRVPDKYLASFLGITPVSLSRIRNRISKQGIN
jgi:CRP-like cAMP-binding protein